MNEMTTTQYDATNIYSTSVNTTKSFSKSYQNAVQKFSVRLYSVC